ncbi:MAG TPA: hypothetical protein VMF52_21460 [Steroidobacteraceae bacterium]|nr:hypothetical protein [Steroidobacteraceae bacterium]
MRRLTLILSDLYLQPESDAAEAASPLVLPNFEWLLRVASRREFTGDWRRAFAPITAPAAVAARGLLAPDDADRAWFATPVSLDLHIDHVRLNPRGLLRLAPGEAAVWCAAFARDFGPGHALHDGGSRGFFLTGLAATAAPTVDPARLLGGDVAPALRRPGEPDRLELARLATEIEFWLHASPLNAAREAARRPRITTLWLWGGGPPGSASAQLPAATRVFGADPFLVGLARASGGMAAPAPDGFDALPEAAEMIVELAPMSGPRAESLATLDARWFAPARAALSRGALELDIRANDRRWCIGRGAGWRFWRPRRPWLASLAHPAAATKA